MTKGELEIARKRFKFADEAEKKQREREREDLGFYEGESQWSSDIRTMRKGMAQSGNNPAVPAKPTLTFNQVRDPVRRVQNDELQMDMGMSITAADDFNGSIESREIELREGLARRIQRDSNAMDARMWAAGRALISGRGFYSITTRWCEGDTFDQEVAYERLYDQFSALVDPAHEQPDGSDMEWGFTGRDLPLDTYRSRYPKLANGRTNPITESGVSDSDWRAFADDAPGWIQGEGDNKAVRVTRYWRYERNYREIVLLDDGSVVPASALSSGLLEKIPTNRRREREIKEPKLAVIDGLNTLEVVDWPGKYIPLIKVVGEEIHPFDQQRRTEGLIRNSRDPQQAFNVMLSEIVNLIAMGPKSRIIAAAGQLEGFEDMWQQAAVRNWPYLLYNLTTDATAGQILPPPQFINSEPPIQAMAQMLVAFQQGIMSAISQPSLSDTHPDVRSGKMAQALIDDALRGTNNYSANLVRSVHFEGKIVNDLLYPIYGIRPGRILSMVSGAGKSSRVMIGKPFVVPEQGNGRPQAFDATQHSGMEPQTYTLTEDGMFNVAIEATKYFETKKQERVQLMGGIIEKSPEQLSVIGDRFFELVGDDEMAKRYSAVLDPRVVAMLREGQPPDPRLEQAMEMGRQVSQELMQLKADKGARIEQAQIKALADTTTSDKDNETKILIARIQQETAVMVADLKATVQQQADAAQGIQEQMRTLVELLNEERLASKQREHERESQHHAQAHELGMAIVEHKHAKDALEHEAATMPSPNGSGE